MADCMNEWRYFLQYNRNISIKKHFKQYLSLLIRIAVFTGCVARQIYRLYVLRMIVKLAYSFKLMNIQQRHFITFGSLLSIPFDIGQRGSLFWWRNYCNLPDPRECMLILCIWDLSLAPYQASAGWTRQSWKKNGKRFNRAFYHHRVVKYTADIDYWVITQHTTRDYT